MSGPSSHYELRLGLSLLRRSHTVALLTPVLLLTAALLWALLGDEAALGGVLEALTSAATEGSPSGRFHAWALLVLSPVGAVMLLLLHRARLRISIRGLEGYLPAWTGFGLQGLTTGRFLATWNEVESVSLQSGGRFSRALDAVRGARLVVRTRDGRISLSPFVWVERNGADHRLTLTEALRSGAGDGTAWVMRSPLVQALEGRGYDVRTADASEPSPLAEGYDLARHRGMVALMSVMALAGGYGLVDGFATGPYQALEPVPLWPFAMAAAVAVALAAVLGRGAPTAERMGVGALAVAAVVAAVHPAMLRVNGATGTPHTVMYTVSGPGTLSPPDSAWPAIDLGDRNLTEYWQEHPPGTEHPMTLVKGVAGFHQLDSRPLFERTRAFYRRR